MVGWRRPGCKPTTRLATRLCGECLTHSWWLYRLSGNVLGDRIFMCSMASWRVLKSQCWSRTRTFIFESQLKLSACSSALQLRSNYVPSSETQELVSSLILLKIAHGGLVCLAPDLEHCGHPVAEVVTPFF